MGQRRVLRTLCHSRLKAPGHVAPNLDPSRGGYLTRGTPFPTLSGTPPILWQLVRPVERALTTQDYYHHLRLRAISHLCILRLVLPFSFSAISPRNRWGRDA